MIGKKSGRLTITSHSHKNDIGNYWNTQCDCGNTKKISTGEFNRGRTPVLSCGCYKPPITSYVGLKFFHLLVLEFSHQVKSKSFWKCKCDCGNEKVICSESFKRGLTKSCGCLTTSGSEIFMKNAKERLLSKLKKCESGCWEWIGKVNPSGYGMMLLWGLKIQTAHRASYLLHFGILPKDKLVCHKCDNKICCNPDHLYLGTPKDNTRDAIERGRFPKGPNKSKGHIGEKNSKSKLTNEKVKHIRFLCEKGLKKSIIAEIFGVHSSQIQRIAKGKSWNHI